VENEEKRFGKYVLLSRLAAGGMAVTYRAKMTAAAGLTKDVVIKKIHPHLAEEEDFVEMFVREAKLAASLTHGNIAQVFDFGKTDGDYFLAMELVHGQALSRLLRRAADRDIPFLPIPIALQIVCRMCDGLHYAHTRKDERGQTLNLVHRDVSPENVLVSYEGEVKIVDFGIAKSNAGGKQTETGMVKGKYPYFSPEQAQAARDLDARSDVYAVGVVLFELLCGRRPYEGEFVAVLAQLAEGKIPRPTSFNPEIPPNLEQAMLKALATNRDQRYQSARELGQSLAEVLHSRYPGSTSNDISMLLATLFKEELDADGTPMDVPQEFLTDLLKNTQPGYGAKRRAALGLKPESKATPKPVGVPPKMATPARPRPATNPGVANQHGGYRPKSMGALPPVEKTPPSGTKLEPIEQETFLKNKAARAASGEKGRVKTGEHRVKTGERRVTAGGIPLATPEQLAEQQKRLAEHKAQLTRDTPELKEKRQRYVVTIGGVGVGVSLLAVVLFLIFGGKKEVVDPTAVTVQTELWVTSVPAGAHVSIDTKDFGPAPVKTSVTLGQHVVAVTQQGFRPWTKRFTATAHMEQLQAKLEADVVEPVVAEVKDAGVINAMQSADKTSAEKRDVSWPLRLFVLRTRYNALPLDKYDTTHVELKPGTGYQIFTEGSYSLGKGRGSTSNILYYLEGDMPESKRVGFLSASSKLIKGATGMYVFAIDDDLGDNSGQLRIVMRISQYVVPTTITFDATKNAIVPLPEHRFLLANLQPTSKYLLTIRDDEAATAPGKGGRVGNVLCMENPEKAKPITATHRLLEVGKRSKVTETDSLMCVFPDVALDDNQGSLEVDIVDMDEMTAEDRKSIGEK
jgi:serine/threonine protein kinase